MSRWRQRSSDELRRALDHTSGSDIRAPRDFFSLGTLADEEAGGYLEFVIHTANVPERILILQALTDDRVANVSTDAQSFSLLVSTPSPHC